MIISIMLPVFLIMVFSYIHQIQFTPSTLHEDVLYIDKEDAIYKLNQGWRYQVNEEEQPIKSITAIPFSLKTNETTTLMIQLLVPAAQQIYSVNLDGIHQPFELWVNGLLIRDASIASHKKPILFYSDKQQVELKLVITPANERVALLQSPHFGQADAMQAYTMKKQVIVLIALICLTILGVYSIIFYFSKKYQSLHLYIGVYFLFVSVTLFLSNNGIGVLLLPLSFDWLMKLKTITGLLSVIPLYLFVASINKHAVSRAKVYFLISVAVIAAGFILFAPAAISQPIVNLIWCFLIGILSVQMIRIIAFLVKNRRFDLKHILLIVTLFYLIVYLMLRVYYHIWGTDLQTNLWLINFAISICLYLALDQNQLVRELERSKKDAIQSKISFFNAQIKPHFLYNALSNIMALCYTDNMKAAYLLGKFSTYLRLIFENNMQSEWILLEKELTLIDAYVEMEKARFPQKITYELEAEQHAKGVKIPPLSIQPLVENAIRHGLFNKEEAGTVKVSIQRQLDELVITIQDDGVGMTEQTIKNILEGKEEQQGIGILNIVQRLQFIPNSHFNIQSALNQGTIVTLQIPIQSYGEENHPC